MAGLRQPAEGSSPGFSFKEETRPVDSDLVNELLNEVRVVQLELEVQNQELKASYESLEAERMKLAGFFDLAPVGYLILNRRALLEDINQAGLDMLMVKRPQIIGKRLQEFLDPEESELFHHFLYRMQLSPAKQSCGLEIKTPNEQLIYTRLEGKAITPKDKENLKYYITLTDVTASRNAAHKLLETKERLEMTLAASATGTWGIDVEHKRFFMDDFSYSLLGLKPGGFDGTKEAFLKMVCKEDRQLINQSIRDAIYREKEIDIEFRVSEEKDAFKYVAVRGHLVKLQEGTRHLAGILMDITEKKKLQLQAREFQLNQQRLVLDAEFRAQEKERKKISEALHDGVCQYLYGIRLNLQAIEKPSSFSTPFKKINLLLDQAERETRAISYELNPSILNDFGFVAGVRELAQRLSAPPLFHIHAEVSNKANKLPEDIQLPVFRIIQELINNAIKHARAKKVQINLCTKGGELDLSVMDDGKGFNKDKVFLKGSGLRGIRNRVFMLNGKFDIQSSPQSGTYIRISFNIDGALAALEAG